jgi:hypothetical protein
MPRGKFNVGSPPERKNGIDETFLMYYKCMMDGS